MTTSGGSEELCKVLDRLRAFFLVERFSAETVICFFFFFFSSRRRHTRCSRDWSSDVCSSDLSSTTGKRETAIREAARFILLRIAPLWHAKARCKVSIAFDVLRNMNQSGT